MSTATPQPSGPPLSPAERWPPLPLDEWRDTYATLHLMTQVVGKVRLACAPVVNHSWHVPLYVTARGLTTSAMPHGERQFQIDFDFIEHLLRIQVSDGEQRSVALRTRPVADFYHDVMESLLALRVPVRIWPRAVEIEATIRIDEDVEHTVYEPEQAQRFWRALSAADRAMSEFRSSFVGKCSPVHFFWGSFDHAVTRFSGRRAPEHPGGIPNLADRVAREAYSRECSSCGFWPGSGAVQEAAFYAYAYPEPAGYREHPIRPAEAFYSDEMREYVLPYEAVRRAAEPEQMLRDFFQSTYEAGAVLGGWDRGELEHEYPGVEPPAADPAPAFPRHPEEPGGTRGPE